ncbi:GNAT family N-acetyltransferase [Candidatus Eisenbacteria bacterium]|uniref:GNAT family N-acetyltransferase n=1 Tax=Eiseniibacteriota bacterium TaxID=2212470 RepID=A0ABV6YJL5_UNCEI
MRDTLSGEKVTIRAHMPAHVAPLFAAVEESISDLAPYETWCHPGYTKTEAAEYVDWWRQSWEKGRAHYFAIECSSTGDYLGSCGLSELLKEHKRASMGFWLRSSRTGEGLATDAARMVARFGFEDLGLERIEIESAVHNAASRRIAEKLGAKLEGILRKRLILPTGPTDTAMYSLMRDSNASV